MSDPFDVRGVTSGNIPRDNGVWSSSSEMPPPLPGVSGDGTSAAAILTDGNQAVEETPTDLGALTTGLDGLAHTPPVLTPPVPSGEVTLVQSVPPQDKQGTLPIDVTDSLDALEDVLRTQRQAFLHNCIWSGTSCPVWTRNKYLPRQVGL